MAYEIIGWKNKGETGAKPINRDNLRHMDNGILNLDTYKAEIIPLLTVSDTAPVECERGDLYYNTTTELIYVATQPDTWSEEGTTPSIFNLYVDLSSSKLYYYDGTNFNSYGSGGGGETLPVGTELDFDGTSQDIPTGWEQIETTVLRKELTADASGNAGLNWQNLGNLYLDLTPGTWYVKANAYFITTGVGVGYNKSCLSTNITGGAPYDRLDTTADMFSSSLNSDFASAHNLSCIVSVSTTTRIYLLESFAYTGSNSSITLKYDTSTTTPGLSFIEARKLN